MRFVELSESEVKHLKFACDNFLQSWEMYQRYQKLGRESYFIGVKNDEKILAAGLMVVRRWHFGQKIFRVPGGWLLDYDASNRAEILEFLTREAGKFCRERKGMMLEISPNIVSELRDMYNNVVDGRDHLDIRETLQELGFKYLGEYEQVKWTFVIDLAGQNPEQMFKEFRTTHRQRIHCAERNKVRIRELTIDELPILKKITAEAGERHGFQDPDIDYYRSMKEAFGDKVKFVVAEIPAENLPEEDRPAGQEYVPLAGAMFVHDNKEMVYLYSGSVRKLQKYGGAYLIQWHMIQEAFKTGCKKYNFYGVKPIEGNGVYMFKMGFRGVVEELLGTFVLPLNFIGKLYCWRLKMHEYGSVH